VPQTVLLNNVDHADLRVVTRRGAEYGDAVMAALTFPDEFRSLQAHYPIVFRKTPDGASFMPMALFGLREGQNLFLGANGWDASYVPLAIERQPFLIGNAGGEWVVHVDLDSPRIDAGGEPVFRPHGGTTELLDRMSSVLLAIHDGLQQTPAFVAALLEHDLLESFVFDVELPDGSQNRLAGFYTVNEDRLHRLGGAALEKLHRAGHLQAIYMVLASLSNLRDLVERLNRQHATAV
jgi:hypothetical protein